MFACESVPLSQGSPRGLRQKSLGHLTLKVGKSDFRQQIRSMAIFLPTDPNFLIKILVPNFTLNENSLFSDSALDLPLGKAPKAELQALHYAPPCLLYYPTNALTNNDASNSLLLLKEI